MTRPPADRTRLCTRRRVLAGGAALAATLPGCSAPTSPSTPAPEASATVRLTNRDDVSHAYEVVVRFGEGTTDRFSGVLPADTDQVVEMVATGRPAGATCEFGVGTAGRRRGRTRDPAECPALVVDAYVADGRPGFETTCGGA